MKTSHIGIAVGGALVGAASMVVVYASGMIHQGTQLPQTATVQLQEWRNSWKNGTEVRAAYKGTFDYNEFEKIYALLKKNYFDQEKINTGALMEGALKGMVAALGDPHTTFFDTQENSDFNKELKGQQDFEGIGASVDKKDSAIEIQEVYKGTPSFEAGLRPLDLVIEINGEKTTDMSTEQAVSKIRGPEGTSVELTVFRPSETTADKKLFKVTIVRKKVIISSVKDELLTIAGKKIGYINISIIGQQTEDGMKQSVEDLKEQGAQGIILDLRGNQGGFLEIGVQIASHFIPKGQTIVTTRYRDPDENKEYQSAGYGQFDSVPIVVLVDSITASAGEIIAGALREDRGSLLVGTTTFGKGSIQTIEDFGSGSAIKYTVGRRYTPHDENVDGTGLKVDIEVPFDPEAYKKDKTDNQLDRAKIEIVKLIK